MKGKGKFLLQQCVIIYKQYVVGKFEIYDNKIMVDFGGASLLALFLSLASSRNFVMGACSLIFFKVIPMSKFVKQTKRIELGNLLENFKVDILGDLS